MERSLDDVLRDSTGSADFQKKMAKAMRVRAERHEHALTLLKHEHAAQIAKMQEEARELKEAVERQRKEEMEVAMERANERMERYVRFLVGLFRRVSMNRFSINFFFFSFTEVDAA